MRKSKIDMKDDLLTCIKYADCNEQFSDLIERICRMYECGILSHGEMCEMAGFLIVCHTQFVTENEISTDAYLENEKIIGEFGKSKCLENKDIYPNKVKEGTLRHLQLSITSCFSGDEFNETILEISKCYIQNLIDENDYNSYMDKVLTRYLELWRDTK